MASALAVVGMTIAYDKSYRVDRPLKFSVPRRRVASVRAINVPTVSQAVTYEDTILWPK